MKQFHFKFRTIRFQLFFSFTLLFIVMWTVFGVFIYHYFSNKIKEQVISSQMQICSAIEESLNYQIETSNTLSMNIAYSDLVRNSFVRQHNLFQYISKNNTVNDGILYTNATECSYILSNIVGYSYYVIPQVNLYDFEGHIIGYGLYNGLYYCPASSIPWLQQTTDLDGKKYISSLHQMEWMNIYDNQNTGNYISLSRVYKNSHYEPIGYIEVIQDCDLLFHYVNQIAKTTPDMDIYIFNLDGDCIYPYLKSSSNNKTVEFLSLYKSNSSEESSASFESVIQSVPCLTSKTYSDETMLTIYVSQPYTVITDALYNYNKFFFLLIIICLLIILITSYWLSDKITKPLTQLRTAIKVVDLRELTISSTNQIVINNNEMEEIASIMNSFNTMHEELRTTINELLLAKNEEINSKILAIQAQMNPHFLHNNLANIISMADENMVDQIKEVCNSLSFMLRYISTESIHGVELMQELDYTREYVKCLKIRYEEDLDVQIHVPYEMQGIIVPKLIIQPLIENAIKHGCTKQSPPWQISVIGNYQNGGFTISVSDSGTGFTASSLRHIMEQIEIFNQTAQIPHLEIDGMGLLNIYIRLKLTYKEHTIFEIKSGNNHPGTTIIMGTKLLKNKEDL